MKTGYSIRTWRMRLVCPEPIWLDRTEEYFQNVVEFYYHLLRQHEEPVSYTHLTLPTKA